MCAARATGGRGRRTPTLATIVDGRDRKRLEHVFLALHGAQERSDEHLGRALPNSATRASGAVADAATLDDVIKRLSPRWFVVRDAQGKSGTLLVRPRTALTWLRGPLTRGELVRARAAAV